MPSSPPLKHLSPEGVHVGDDVGNGDVVVAYHEMSEDSQGVLRLLGPLSRQLSRSLGQDDQPANYATFELRNKTGRLADVRHWSNLHDASNWMQEQMGADR